MGAHSVERSSSLVSAFSTYSDGESNGDKVVFSRSTGKVVFSKMDLVYGSSEPRAESCIECWGCRNEIARPLLLRSVFLVVVAIGLIFSGLITHFSIYGQEVHVFTEGDMIHFPVSTYFCSGIKYSFPESSGAVLHVLSRSPILSAGRKHYSTRKQFSLPSWSYQYWTFYLLPGSQLDTKICADQYINFIVLKGTRSFQDWTESMIYKEHFLKRGIHGSRDCTTTKSFTEVNIPINHEDTYYILFSSSSGFTFVTTVSVQLILSRTVYNLTHSVSSTWCNSTVFCQSSLKYKSTETTVLEFLGGYNTLVDPLRTAEVSVAPIPRFWFYLAVFGGIFGVIIVVTLLYSLYRKLARRMSKQKEGTPLISEYKSHRLYSRKVVTRMRKPSQRVDCIPEEYENENSEGNANNGAYGQDNLSNYSLLMSSYEEEGVVNPNYIYARHPSLLNEGEEETTNYSAQRQLLDSCMTSASISAI